MRASAPYFWTRPCEQGNWDTWMVKKKKKDDKKTKAFYDWATTGIPVITFARLKDHKKPVVKYQP